MRVKLLQWNILYKEKIENVVKQIKELNSDIVCLQELGVNSKYNPSIPNTAEYVKEQLGFNAFFEEALRWEIDGEMNAIANGIFTRFPIVNTSSHFCPKSRRRIYIETDLQVDKKVITVGTTHLSYVPRFKITNEKRSEVDNLLGIIKNKKERFIFTGDLNSTPDSYTITELSKCLQNCGPAYNQNTWTTKPFDYQGFRESELKWRLDYIFATQDVKCISSEIIQTDYSDHLPILAVLEI